MLLVTTSSFSFFIPKDLKNAILITSAVLRKSATHATDFKTLPQNLSFPGKNYVRYKLVAEANLK
jgi:hypothetical protein